MDVLNYINQISIDCVIFGYKEQQLKVLISKLNYKGDFYALPTGFIFQEEDVEVAAKRIVQERTGIKDIYLEHFNIFGKANRKRKEFIDELIKLNYIDSENEQKNNPLYQWFTNRFVSIGYYSLVNIKKVKLQLTNLDESMEWYNIQEVPKLIMDHDEILQQACKRLHTDIDEKLNIFNLLPDQFTMKDVQEIYEAIFDKTFVRTNFQKKILDFNVLERLDKQYTGAKNKAPYLYRFKK